MNITFGCLLVSLVLALFLSRWIQLVIRCWQLTANEPAATGGVPVAMPWFLRLRPLLLRTSDPADQNVSRRCDSPDDTVKHQAD
jgi:hypothetical protein